MKPFFLASLLLFTLSLSFPNLQAFFTVFAVFPLLANLWLVPGGFAWRNHYLKNFPKLPGPIGWPFLGSIPEMGSLAHRKLAAMAAAHSANRLMAFSLGATPAIVSSHPDTAKEILRGSAFSDRPMKESTRLLMFERAIGFAPSGDYWRSLRRIAATHMFSPRIISGLEGLRCNIAVEMAAGVRKEMEEKGFVKIRGILQQGSLSNVVETVFGSGLGSRGEELGLMVEEGYDLIAKFNLADHFAGLGFLDFYGVKRRCHKLALKVSVLIAQIISERKKEGDNKLSGKNDFLSTLITLPKEDQLCDSDMAAVLWEMIFRGTDTVALLLEWIMARMVLHPDIQANAQLEIDTCVGNRRQVRDSDIPYLPFLQAIVKEALRLHPPGPLLSWARLAVHDCQVGKFFIPAGTTAMVNMWAIAHDPSIWKDPWAFRPERFLHEEEEHRVSIMGSDLRLAPFGAGRRACPGKALGLASVHLWLAHLLHQFKWVPAQPVDLSECLRLSLEMKKPLACRAIPRGELVSKL